MARQTTVTKDGTSSVVLSTTREKKCKTHFIRVTVLERMVFKHIQAVIEYILRYENHFKTYMKEQMRQEKQTGKFKFGEKDWNRTRSASVS